MALETVEDVERLVRQFADKLAQDEPQMDQRSRDQVVAEHRRKLLAEIPGVQEVRREMDAANAQREAGRPAKADEQ